MPFQTKLSPPVGCYRTIAICYYYSTRKLILINRPFDGGRKVESTYTFVYTVVYYRAGPASYRERGDWLRFCQRIVAFFGRGTGYQPSQRVRRRVPASKRYRTSVSML